MILPNSTMTLNQHKILICCLSEIVWWLMSCLFSLFLCMNVCTFRQPPRRIWARWRVCWPRSRAGTLCWARQAIHTIMPLKSYYFTMHVFTLFISVLLCYTILVASFGFRLEPTTIPITPLVTPPTYYGKPWYQPRTLVLFLAMP